MDKVFQSLLLGNSAILAVVLGVSPAIANEDTTIAGNTEMLQRLDRYGREGNGESIEQVTNVNQLRDVQPTDWAYEALRSLVDRYGCITGFPNQTYRGSQPLTRYEFAAGLNSCLNQVERLIAASEQIAGEDIETLQRLMQEFEAELATIGGRVDNLEGRVAFLEDNQFSTTTRLEGEVVFGLAQEFNAGDSQVVFQDRVRLAFVSSFTGEDALYTRLDAGNAALFNSREEDEDGEILPIDQGTFTYSFDSDNNVEIGWLAYYFPIGDKIQVYLPAAFPLWVDFVPSISPYLDAFTGATGALSSFAESSPIYKIGLAAGGGLGINFTPIESIVISAGYFGGNTFEPTEGNGLFNGEYSALGQVAWTPFDRLQVAATFVRGYFTEDDSTIFDLGIGTPSARQPFEGTATTANSYGLEASFQVSSLISVNAFGLYTDAQEAGNDDSEAEIWSYGVGLAFPDLLKEGSLGGVIVGAEPYNGAEDDVALHFEGFYKYQYNDNISITPGVIWVTAPGGESDADDGIIGVVRTTFTF